MALTVHLIILMHVCTLVVVRSDPLPKPNFSSILVFGDSSADSGNNNYIMGSLAKANHLPYGKDFPGHVPTGRFSNGKLVIDFLASILNIKDGVPPYLNPNLPNKELLTGVCFASGGSGFDDCTAASANAISMTKQIEYFKAYVAKLNRITGENETKQILGDALVIIGAGSNDFLLKFYDRPHATVMFNINMYQDYLLDRLQILIKDLYDYECRKFLVSGLPPIGCIPFQITLKFERDRKCVLQENFDAEQYNQKLVQRLLQIQAMLPGSRLVYLDLYYSILNLINHPENYGLEVTNRGCCGLGALEVTALCNKLTPVCNDASKYVFWDSFHLSEVSNQYLAKCVEINVLPQFCNSS
ncbi:hypothetical protein JHK87_005002 [Glycine soja]|nr:hypothetical protein JHK87_005002 [Glycine soja]